MLGRIGMREIEKNSVRLNNYLASVDDDLKALVGAFNENMTKLQTRFEQLDTKITELTTLVKGKQEKS